MYKRKESLDVHIMAIGKIVIFTSTRTKPALRIKWLYSSIGASSRLSTTISKADLLRYENSLNCECLHNIIFLPTIEQIFEFEPKYFINYEGMTGDKR